MHYFGAELQERMNILCITVSDLADMTFLDEDTVNNIINNKSAFEEIDEFDYLPICSALHCDPNYFLDEEIKKKDLLISTMNEGNDSVKSKAVKAKIQDFINDFCFYQLSDWG